MPHQIEALGQAVYESTRRTMEGAWPLPATEAGLLELVSAALIHVEGTVEGFRQLGEVSVDCQKGCSFCCWLRIDVRAQRPVLRLEVNKFNLGKLRTLEYCTHGYFFQFKLYHYRL